MIAQSLQPDPASTQPANDNQAGSPPPANDNAISPIITLIDGECLDLLSGLPDSSIDLALLDLPYGTTRMEWDKLIPLDDLWKELRRVLTPKGTVVTFACQPFTTDLIVSARDLFKYPLVWEKANGTNFPQAKVRPLNAHEDILVFSKGSGCNRPTTPNRMTYNPQGLVYVGTRKYRHRRHTINHVRGNSFHKRAGESYEAHTNYPRSVLRFDKDGALHPTQKPVDLLRYLVETYSDPGEIVLDPTMGSGSAGVAALRSGRHFVGFERDPEFFKIAEERIVSDAKYDMQSENTSAPARAENDNDVSTTLIQGDCLEVMRSMESGTVDLVVTSPPYNMSEGRKMSGEFKMKLVNGYATYSDDMPYEDYVEWQRKCLLEMWRLLRHDGAIFYNHKNRVQGGELRTPHNLNPGLPLRQIITWDRGQGFNMNRSFFRPVSEVIYVFAKPAFRLKDHKACLSGDVWRFSYARDNDHPAPFPVELPRRAIAATNAKVILDPFNGSGTTGVAAKLERRDYIGIDVDPGYIEGSRERIAAA